MVGLGVLIIALVLVIFTITVGVFLTVMRVGRSIGSTEINVETREERNRE